MQVRALTIQNFRGLHDFEWQPGGPIVCLVGRGDSGKSTILDAIEAALSPRHTSFSDLDFYRGDVANNIQITVTVGELSSDLLNEKRFGTYIRGWTKQAAIRDEPEGDDESVLTVQLTVDASLEGEWKLHTDRHEPRHLSARDRIHFGLVRLTAEVDRHLTWGRGTALSALTEERGSATSTLADAFRTARETIATNPLTKLDEVAGAVSVAAKRLGAYASTDYSAGLDTQRTSMSLGGISLHEGLVPVRLAGLGSRRIVTLAIQRLSVDAGAIVLIDEIEHGLEPHRIRYALKLIRDAVAAKPEQSAAALPDPPPPTPKPGGQIFLTTHSPTTVVELECTQLRVCVRKDDQLDPRTPTSDLQALVRRVPEAFLSRRVLICEGPTEIGLIRGLRDLWTSRRSYSFESLGSWLADGAGSSAPKVALSFSRLGFECALFRDSDIPLSAQQAMELASANVAILEWGDDKATEQRLFDDVRPSAIQALLAIAIDDHGEDSILQRTAKLVGVPKLPGSIFGDWLATGKTEAELRVALGVAAKGNGKDVDRGWFKNITFGERVGQVVAGEIKEQPTTPLARTLSAVEQWLYGG